jgi:excisionase family DNA binding protein
MDSETQKEFLTIRDLQQISGEAEPTWRKRLSRRELPFSKFGANVRIRRADFDKWVAARTVGRGSATLGQAMGVAQ